MCRIFTSFANPTRFFLKATCPLVVLTDTGLKTKNGRKPFSQTARAVPGPLFRRGRDLLGPGARLGNFIFVLRKIASKIKINTKKALKIDNTAKKHQNWLKIEENL